MGILYKGCARTLQDERSVVNSCIGSGLRASGRGTRKGYPELLGGQCAALSKGLYSTIATACSDIVEDSGILFRTATVSLKVWGANRLIFCNLTP